MASTCIALVSVYAFEISFDNGLDKLLVDVWVKILHTGMNEGV